MLNHVRLADGFYMQMQAITKPTATVTKTVTKTVAVDDPEGCIVNVVIDVSGSMYGNLRDVKEDTKKKIRNAKKGDRFTIAWFSSPHGDNGILVQGASADTDKDKAALCAIVDRLEIRGATCFAEILEKFPKISTDMAAYNLPNSLLFLSDGYPTDGYPTGRILKALEALSPHIDSALLVGYGNYYNKELMAQMAEKVGGQVVHSSDISSFSTTFTTFVEEVREAVKKTKVDVKFGNEDLGGIYQVRGRSITMLGKDNDSRVEVGVPRNGDAYIYGFVSKPAPGSVEIAYNVNDSSDPTVKGLYAGAMILNQKLKADKAAEVMSAVGDKAMVTALANAFTPADYGKVESALARAVERKDARFKQGRKVGCLPKKDAWCLQDTIDLLMADNEARFFPYHPEFTYNRIGTKSEVEPGYPEFEADPNPSCALDSITPHGELLNLSALVRIPGHIELDKNHKKHGFPSKIYKTFVWRNYAWIKDGNANCEKVPLAMSKATFEKLEEEGMVTGSWKKGQPVIVDFSSVTVMNRAMAEGLTSAKPLCELKKRELEAQAEQKVVKFYLDALTDGEGLADKTPLTDEQKEYLKTQGVSYNGFQPPTKKLPPTDHYLAKEFDIKIGLFSSLPSVNKVLEKLQKIDDWKKTKKGKQPELTASEDLMNKTILEVKKEVAKYSKSSDPRFLHWLQGKIEANKIEFKDIRSKMQRTKMAVILANKWFDEFTTRDNAQITHKGFDFTFALREIRVDL